jgi:hypothetical protein
MTQNLLSSSLNMTAMSLSASIVLLPVTRLSAEGDSDLGLMLDVNPDLNFPLFTDFIFPVFGAELLLETVAADGGTGSDLYPVLHTV